MKNMFVSAYKAILCMVLFSLVLWLAGCTRPGETAAEGQRRHMRNLWINQQELNQDLDTALLLDQPSKLSERKIP